MSLNRMTTGAIRQLFEEETATHGGRVKDAFDDGSRLFLRSVLPSVQEVRPEDGVQPGVALRGTAEEVRIHPYLFRQVCTNGAIIAQALKGRTVWLAMSPDADDAASTIRAAIRECSTEEVFAASLSQMRSTIDHEDDVAISMMSFLGRIGQDADSGAIGDVLQRFFGDGDRSAFGWMNAITSVARDTEDPELRWRLEQAGGGVPATLQASPIMPFSAGVDPFERYRRRRARERVAVQTYPWAPSVSPAHSGRVRVA